MKKVVIDFISLGSLMTGIFLFIVNMITTPHTIWFIYPCIFLLLWPGMLYFAYRNQLKTYSVITSFVIILTLFIINMMQTPDILWFLYPAYPIIWWPILIYLGRRAGEFSVSLTGAIVTIIYYGLLNMIISPEYVWFIYPSFAVIWWPLTIYHVKRKSFVSYSVWASVLISLFFITVNMVTTPNEIWAIYPIFSILWWPLSMYFFVYKRKQIIKSYQ